MADSGNPKAAMVKDKSPIITQGGKPYISPIFENSKFDYAIVCANCGHINELHKHYEDGGNCVHGKCDCYDFKVKTDDKGHVIYDK